MTACKIDGCDNPVLCKGICNMHYHRMRSHGSPGSSKTVYPTEPYGAILRRGVARKGECLLLKGQPSKYGMIKFRGRPMLAHRISFEKWNGHIPDGLVIDHVCHNEAAMRGECSGGSSCYHGRCVNPVHLRAVTPAVNIGASPLTGNGGLRQKSKTHCPRNHAYSEENTYVYQGRRNCRECSRIRRRKSWTN